MEVCSDAVPIIIIIIIIGFLDDLTLGGPVTTVASDVQAIIREAGHMGLTLNFTKCVVIQSHEVDLPATFDSFATTPPDYACLLGAPLSAGNALEVARDVNVYPFKRLTDRWELNGL